ncbi:MAG: hypothetical protein HYZ27_10040 [Deltaproteobacteria bacterium]|nr:hypothetical protein [Deltaproteobacteria bacterium]
MRLLRLVPALAVLFAGACAWWMSGRREPPPSDKLTFNHALHSEAGVACADCHGEVAGSTDAAQSFHAKEEKCLECHERDNCGMCHSDVKLRTSRGADERIFAFAHKNHVPRAQGDCARCHIDVATTTALPVHIPSMEECGSCHNHAEDLAQASCLGCHPSLRSMPLRALAQLDHGGDWMSRHGMLSRSEGAACLQCHSQATCSECHSSVAPAVGARLFPEQVERTLLHRGDFVSTHPIEARADGDLCLRCHGASFCVSCHQASGLTQDASVIRNPHPPGYALPGGAAFHGTDARLRIETCAACHDQGAASVCVECHRVGGVGGNPHPGGWAKRHPESQVKNNAMCRTCHF